jgi:hypothetical protein
MPDELAKLQPGEDYYYDGPYVVFTAQYHLKRGTCCNSGCRHCPYRSRPAKKIANQARNSARSEGELQVSRHFATLVEKHFQEWSAEPQVPRLRS